MFWDFYLLVLCGLKWPFFSALDISLRIILLLFEIQANRSAKLKQCKLDARREQWLSQGIGKNPFSLTRLHQSCALFDYFVLVFILWLNGNKF